MANVRASVNQRVQVGAETSGARGTPVACNRLLDAFVWTFGPKVATKQFRGTGRQYPSASELLWEQAQGKVNGPLDFAQTVYLLSSLFGVPTPALHSPSTTAYDWIWKPPLTGSYAANAQSYTVQQGDTVDAEQYAFLVLTGWGYKFGRKQEATISADWISQTLTDGASLTASPTVIAQLPSTGAQYNLYLDTTSSGIGGTQLTDPLDVSFAASGFWDGYWPINRANASFTNLVDKEKKNEFKVKLQANSTGIAIKGSYLATGSRAYVRVDGQGQIIDSGNSIAAEFKHDMAVFVSDVSEFSDTDGVYAVEYTCCVAEDTSWSLLAGGTAQALTLTNLLSAL